MEQIEVSLNGGAPWGFRIQGGREFHSPIRVTFVSLSSLHFLVLLSFVLTIRKLYIPTFRRTIYHPTPLYLAKRGWLLQTYHNLLIPSQLKPGGKASRELKVGDTLYEINGRAVRDMTHTQAEQEIKRAGSQLKLGINRWGFGQFLLFFVLFRVVYSSLKKASFFGSSSRPLPIPLVAEQESQLIFFDSWPWLYLIRTVISFHLFRLSFFFSASSYSAFSVHSLSHPSSNLPCAAKKCPP